ncbi:MAG TPA: alpha/beta hydrolase [Anaerolineales bacterium]
MATLKTITHNQVQVNRIKLSGAAIALALAAFSGLLVALGMARGPVTAVQALIVLLSGLAVGLIAGFAMPSRWVLLLAPLAHILAIEITRLGTAGPTIDAIRLDSPYGILALILGRGFHGLVGILPMVIGSGLGSALSRRKSGQVGALHWIPAAAGSIAVMTLAILILLPARTPAVLGPDGGPLPGSIAELTTVRIGGHDQALMIHAATPDKPVLLYLSGGPGQSDLAFSRLFFEKLAQDFVVVGWDQRGTGKSYPALDPVSTLTLDRAVSDTIQVTNYLRQRFDEDKIYLLGESWGTTLGVLAVQRRPDLYYAWIGSGQMVSQRVTDQRLYHDMLALAERKGDADLANQMRTYGEPPYADIPYANAFVMGYYEQLYEPYTLPQAYLALGEKSGLDPYGVLGSEYNLVEKVNVLRGLMDMFTIMYPQLQHIDFRQDVPRLEVPVYILDGGAELGARRDLALEWFDQLEAPSKRIFSFENAAHSVAFEQFEQLHSIMLDTVLPETYQH